MPLLQALRIARHDQIVATGGDDFLGRRDRTRLLQPLGAACGKPDALRLHSNCLITSGPPAEFVCH